MEQNIIFSEELKKLQKMKEEMDRLWKNLFVETPNRREKEIWQWRERLPKCEGGKKKLEPQAE